MAKDTICIIFGGASSEHEVSCMSAYGILSNIDYEKHDVIKLAILKDGRQFLYNGSLDKIKDASFAQDTDNLVPAVISPCPAHHGIMVLNKQTKTFEVKNVDLFWPSVHGEMCEDGNLQGLLKLSGVSFVGCDNASSAVCMDKSLTKALLEKTGLPMAKWHVFYKDGDREKGILWCEENLRYPIFVKPCSTGSSVGVRRAENRKEFEEALNEAFRYGFKVLAEETIVGSEIEIAVLEMLEDGKKTLLVSKPGELVNNAGFYDYDNKYKNDTTSFYIPARLDDAQINEVMDYAKLVFTHLDCRTLSRVDFFKTENGFVFNEINTLPGFTSISMYPKLMQNMGISYSRLIDLIIESARG